MWKFGHLSVILIGRLSGDNTWAPLSVSCETGDIVTVFHHYELLRLWAFLVQGVSMIDDRRLSVFCIYLCGVLELCHALASCILLRSVESQFKSSP